MFFYLIKYQSNDYKILKRIIYLYILFFYNKKFIKFNKFVSLPKKIKKYTVLKSTHVNKKSKDTFSITYYTKYIKLIITQLRFNNILLNFIFKYLLKSNCLLIIKKSYFI